VLPSDSSFCTQGDHPIIPGPLAPPVNFAQAGTEAQTVNYAALPNPTTLPNPITICPDGVLHMVTTRTSACEGPVTCVTMRIISCNLELA